MDTYNQEETLEISTYYYCYHSALLIQTYILENLFKMPQMLLPLVKPSSFMMVLIQKIFLLKKTLYSALKMVLMSQLQMEVMKLMVKMGMFHQKSAHLLDMIQKLLLKKQSIYLIGSINQMYLLKYLLLVKEYWRLKNLFLQVSILM